MDNSLRKKRHHRFRHRVTGTKTRPRASVFRSISRISVQLIDDTKGVTLVSAAGRVDKKTNKTQQAQAVGMAAAKAAKAKGIKEIVFDRGGYKYHGRVRALAEAMREGGLVF